jgi:hypothetical protein
MKTVKVIAHYKTATCKSFWQLASFKTQLPDDEASRLLNDREGRKRLVMLHYPSVTEISGDVNYSILWDE